MPYRNARPLLALALCQALVILPLSAQTGDSSQTVRTLLAADQAFWRAEIAGDTVAISHLLAPTYESFDAGQGTVSRSQLMSMLRPDSAGESEAVANWQVRDYGATGVISLDYTMTSNGHATHSVGIDVWSRDGSGWKLVFSTLETKP